MIRRRLTLALIHALFLVAISFHAGAVSAEDFQPRGPGGGGALFGLSINPAKNTEFFVACDMGSLFHTTDFGASYSQVHFSELEAGNASTVCFTKTEGLLYSITYGGDMTLPVKSTDGGKTWVELSGNPDDYEELFSIFADFDNPMRIVLADYNEIHFSSDGGDYFESVYRAKGENGVAVAGVFFDGDTVIIGTSEGVLLSTDGGESFEEADFGDIPSDEAIWSFAGAKENGLTRLFCLTASARSVYPGMPGTDYWDFYRGVYTLDYGRGAWVPKNKGIRKGKDFPVFLALAACDTETAYLAGADDRGEPVIMKTTDGGGVWKRVFLTRNNRNIATGWSGFEGDRDWTYGECALSLSVDRADPNVLCFSDLGFIHTSRDGGATWRQAYSGNENPAGKPVPRGKAYRSSGLEVLSCWQLYWIDKETMWACTSDVRGMISRDGGKSWGFGYSGLGANTSYRIAGRPGSGVLFLACSNVHDIYQSTRLQDEQLDVNDANGKIMFSSDKGKTWKDLKVFGHPVYWVETDPSNPDRAWASVIHYNGGAGSGGIYVCNDLGKLAASTWTRLPDPPRTEKHPASIVALKDGKILCSYSGRRGPEGFTPSSGIFLYDPASNKWEDLSDPAMKYWTRDVVVDPDDPDQNTWYAAVFSGWGGPASGLGGLYRTTDRGRNWENITGSSIDRVSSCTPLQGGGMFVTSEGQGLWYSEDRRAEAPVFEVLPSYGFRQPERVFVNPYASDEFWVCGFGGGLMTGVFSRPGF